MPGFVLHEGATILCAHQGRAEPMAPARNVTVGGRPVVVQNVPHTISACPFTTPGGTPQPCVSARWTTGATRVRVNGERLLLQDSRATCPPNGTPVTVSRTQMRVRGR
jgi:hypothetical protein